MMNKGNKENSSNQLERRTIKIFKYGHHEPINVRQREKKWETKQRETRKKNLNTLERRKLS